VLSCILFNTVFQMLLDLIEPLSCDNGYKFKDIPVVLHDEAFADDLSIMTSTPELNQDTINWVVKFLMKFNLQPNPSKSICMAMKNVSENDGKFDCYGDSAYCPYDPQLTIDGKRLRFIVNSAADPNSLQYDHFKELGRWISVDLKEDKIKLEIKRRVLADLEIVDSCGVNGLCKLFIYEHYVVTRLFWVFLVHDLHLYFVQQLDKLVVPRLKRWAGLFRNSDLGALYRRREHLGLQLTSLELQYKRMQVVKCGLLQSSADSNIRAIYEQRKNKHVAQSRWSGPKELAALEPVVEHSLRFAGQVGSAGLGSCKSRPYIANPTNEDRRQKAMKL
jgi:hypothetical protein